MKVGDIVMLKSGGPNMTVMNVEGTECRALWFDGGELRNAYFSDGVLAPGIIGGQK